MTVNGIDHLNLYVADLSRSLAFYTRVFGFEIREDAQDEEPAWAILAEPGRAYVALHEKPGFRAGYRPGINHWGFHVDDFDAMVERLKELEITPLYAEEGAGGIIQYPKSRSLYIEDPDGHEIELTETFGGGL